MFLYSESARVLKTDSTIFNTEGNDIGNGGHQKRRWSGNSRLCQHIECADCQQLEIGLGKVGETENKINQPRPPV